MLKHSVLLFFFSIFSLPLQSADFNLLEFDLLSVKLLTFDNLFLRLTNGLLIKPEVVTLTLFAIREINILAGVAYNEDLKNSIHEEIKNAFDDTRYRDSFPSSNFLHGKRNRSISGPAG